MSAEAVTEHPSLAALTEWDEEGKLYYARSAPPVPRVVFRRDHLPLTSLARQCARRAAKRSA
jgi:hypothetical protein